MLLFLLGSLNVWGEDVTYTFTTKSWGAKIGDTEANWTSGKAGGQLTANQGIQVTTGQTGANGTSPVSYTNVSKIVVKYCTNASKGVGTIKVQVGNGDEQSFSVTKPSSGGTTLKNAEFDFSPEETGKVKITAECTTNSVYVHSVTITYTPEGDPSKPTVSVTPESWNFGNVAKSAAVYKEFTIAGANLTGNLTFSVTGGYTLSADGATVSEGSVNTTLTVSKNINTTGANNGTLTISGGGLDPSVTVDLTMTVVADPEPTGTFELFSGDLVEGDYVFVVDAKAMTNSISSDKLSNTDVTPSENVITNPDASIIWHIAASGDYWTIYNEAITQYAASTGAKNKAQMLADGTDDKAKWSVAKTGNAFNFQNKANAEGGVNAKLQRNGDYGWACYASYSNISLYKKQVAGQPKAPTFSVEGGNYESAQSVELSCETEGATIYYTTNGDAPTSSSTQYNGTAITVDHTMTIKAIAIKNKISSTVASATYTIIVWQTVADVWDDITADGPKNAHIYGYVSQVNVGGYDNNFYISDNGSTEGNQLYAYRMNMNSFSVAVGDKVKLAGDLMDYQGTKEFKYANSGATQGLVVALEAKGALQSVAVSDTPTKTEYASGEDFDPAGLKVYGTYANGFVGEITEGITWGNDLTDGKVTESTTVHVTATVGGVTSDAHGVDIVVSTKALVSIALSAVEFEVYQGLELPKPTVTATYSEGEPEDVTERAEFTGYDKTTTGEQIITVSYSFGGGEPIAKTYTVTVKPIYNVELAAGVAKTLIETAVGETESTEDMIVRGIVSYINDASNNVQTYWISDDGTRTNEVEIYKGKYLSGANFTTTNQLKVGDEVVVKGKVVYFNSTTPEFASGKSQLQSLARTPNFEIADVASLEVGADDLAVADLTITKDGEGEVTLESSDKEEFVTIEGGKLHAVAPGTATITANLAANGIYKAATYEFSVTVIAAQVKYAITFDDNGADGGSAPEAIEDKAAGVEVTLPANSYTKTGYTFNGWKVFNNSTSAEVEVVAGAFEMPASAVTIQAQWAEIPVWAYTYTSNVTLTAGSNAQNAKVVISETEYDAVKAGTGSKGGNVTVTVPAQATKLHLHAAGWSGENPAISITAPDGVTISPASISATADAGISSNSPFTLKNDPVGQYFALSLSGNTEEIELTFAVDGGSKRFVLYGVNQEGGIVPASIAANPASISFGSVEQNAPVAAKTINVTLTSVNSATVTLAGDDAFSIDKTSLTESGTITVTPNTATVGTYAATITISDVAEEADDVVVNVSMTVTEPVINDDVTGTWNLVTDAADLMEGMKVIVAQSVNASGTIYTMGKQNSNNRAQVESTVDGETLSPAVGTKVITLVDAGNGMFALQTSNGKYLSAAGSGTNNYLKEADDYNSNKEKWTITIADNKAKIQAASTNRNTIRYNSGNSMFSCYAENGQAAIALYAKPFDYTRNVSGNYATICLPKAGQIIGATLYEIAYYGETSKKIFFDEIVNGEMEAGIPYIFQPAAGVEKINVYYSDNTAEDVVAGNRNGLIGFYDLNDPAATHNITQDAGFYILYNNQYWLVSGRAAYVENYRAYIRLADITPSEPTLAPGRRRISMSVNDTQTTTGFENAEANEAPRKVLINGELFILRGEKMYDAKGQLVK